MHKLIFKKAASKYYLKSSPDNKRRLNQAFDRLAKGHHALLDIKPLKGELQGVLRIRVGDLRIFIEISSAETIEILAISPRGDAY